MRPIPVPEWLRAAPWVDGTGVFAAPDGDLTSEQIAPAEGVFFWSEMAGYPDPVPMVGVVLYLEDDDLERIAAGSRHLLLVWPGRRMPVFVCPEVLDPPPAKEPAT